jgi:AraC-like DNA-binding protein
MTDAIFDYRLPIPALREYVRQLQIVGCHFPTAMRTLPMKAYWPRAENTLAFYPRDQERQQYGADGEKLLKPASILSGQHAMVTNRYVGRDFMVFQVQFQPGALFRLTGIPANELTNTFVDAEAVFGRRIRQVNEQLANASHYLQMIPVVEEFLLDLVAIARIRALRPVDLIGKMLLQQPAAKTLDELADRACLSQRQFYRMFVEREGVSPKMFARIARFENAMKIKNKQPHLDWLSVAMHLGYHDYQHLVRDFKEFTGMTPNAFLQQESHAPERTFGVVEK